MNMWIFSFTAAIFLVAGSQLEAKLITYEVSGTVEHIHTDVPVLGSVPPEIQFPLFTVTSTWSATFTLDDDESVYDEIRIDSSQGTKGYINSPGPPMDFTVNLHYAGGGGAYTFSAPAIGDLEFWVGNDLVEVTTPPPFETVTPGGDKLTVVSWVTSGLDDVPWDRQFIILFLRDSTATVFSDDLIPETLDIADFDDNKFNVTFTTADGLAYKHLQLFVDDISLVSIPEPSTCLLAALSGIGLLFHRGFRVRCSNVPP